jgi:hypothetical protein
VLVLAGAAVFLLYVIRRSRSADLPVLRWLKRINRRLAPLWRLISPGLMDVRGSDDEASRDVGRLLLLGVFVIFLGIFAFGADTAGQLFPRAMCVPFILGGWLPFLSNISGFGRQCRAPLILKFRGIQNSFAEEIAAAILQMIFGKRTTLSFARHLSREH